MILLLVLALSAGLTSAGPLLSKGDADSDANTAAHTARMHAFGQGYADTLRALHLGDGSWWDDSAPEADPRRSLAAGTVRDNAKHAEASAPGSSLPRLPPRLTAAVDDELDGQLGGGAASGLQMVPAALLAHPPNPKHAALAEAVFQQRFGALLANATAAKRAVALLDRLLGTLAPTLLAPLPTFAPGPGKGKRAQAKQPDARDSMFRVKEDLGLHHIARVGEAKDEVALEVMAHSLHLASQDYASGTTTGSGSAGGKQRRRHRASRRRALTGHLRLLGKDVDTDEEQDNEGSSKGQGGQGAPAASALSHDLHRLLEHLQALGPFHCYPATRRIVMAALLRQRLLSAHPGIAATGAPGHVSSTPSSSRRMAADASTGRGSGGMGAGASGKAAEGAWDAASQAVVMRIAGTLLAAHRRGAASKGAIEFLHISKSGGTSMCAVAAANDCRTPGTSKFVNCMILHLDDMPRWVSLAVHNRTHPEPKWKFFLRHDELRTPDQPCEKRDGAVRFKGNAFYSNEYTLHGGVRRPEGTHMCPQLMNMALMREPLARLKSHMRWIIRVYRFQYKDYAEAMLSNRTAAYWREFAPAAVDNYEVRSLLGEAGFHLPVGSLNATHLALAQLLLLQYDVVMTLEAPDTNTLHFRQALGWGHSLQEAHSRNNTKSSIDGDSKYLPPADDLADIAVANAWDVALYEYSQLLQALDGYVFALADAAGDDPLGARDGAGSADLRCGYVGQGRYGKEWAGVPKGKGGGDKKDKGRGKADGRGKGKGGKEKELGEEEEEEEEGGGARRQLVTQQLVGRWVHLRQRLAHAAGRLLGWP